MRIARIAGFEIKIDASWFLIATLIVWSLSTGYFPAEMPGAHPQTFVAMAIVAMLGLFGSLILHELAHALVARRFNVPISGITLFLFGGVAELQKEPVNATSEFWISVAGPVSSLCIALGFWFCVLVSEVVGGAEPVRVVLVYLSVINLALALFNLLPAFPMDGGRVLRAYLWNRTGNLLKATRRATDVSAVVAYGFMALGLFAAFSGALMSGLWPILIGLFLLATARATLSRLEADAALDGRTVGDLMTRKPWTARPEHTLEDLVNRIFLEHAVSFVPVVENGVLLGYVDYHMVRRIDRENWPTTTVEDVIESAADDNTVPADMSGRDLIEQMSRTGRRKYLVAHNHVLVGVITLSNLLAFLDVSRQVGSTAS